MSLSDSRKEIKERLDEIAKEDELDLSIHEHRGYAFARYVSETFMAWNVALEQEVEETLSRGGKDKQVDIILRDEDAQVIYIIQAKHKGLGNKIKSISTDEKPAKAFLTLHEDLIDGTVLKTANPFVQENLIDYKDYFSRGWKARFFYVTTEKTENSDIVASYEQYNQKLSNGNYDVEYEIIDTQKLKNINLEIQIYEESIPEKVEIDIPTDLFIENKNAKYPFIIGLLKGNTIRNVYQHKKHKTSLFAWNIRKYLGDKGINKKIKETAENTPEHFFYYNNGITAVCKNYDITSNKLTIEKIQIINGAQTVASIAKAKGDDSLLILFRLIKTGKVDTTSGINSEIIQFNNTQNAIKLSDFRSNDSIQKWLEQEFSQNRTKLIGQTTYRAKRTGKKGIGRVIKLEELAKIRYAFYYNPCLPNDKPKSLWADDARYGEAFGVDNHIVEKWSNNIFYEALFAIAVFDKTKKVIKDKKLPKDDPEYFHLLRFRLHLVSLAGIYSRYGLVKSPIHNMLNSDSKFEEFWNILWENANNAFYYAKKYHYDKKEGKKPSLRAFLRNEEIWNSIQEDFKSTTKIKKTPN